MVVALEVEPNNATPESKVPWALGTVDQVNGVEVSIAGGKWQPADPTNKGSTLEWTFSPKLADVELAPKETLVVELSKIVTAHPTGTANLYLRYQYVPGYQDGEFICPIEKAPLVFDDYGDHDNKPDTPDIKIPARVGIGTTTPSAKLEIIGEGTTFYSATTQKWHEVIIKDGNLGLGTPNPDAKLHVTETVKAKNVEVVETIKAKNTEVVETVKANKFEGDGAVVAGMILMWSGSSDQLKNLQKNQGWKLCDGENDTPDLRNKFIVCAGDKYSLGDQKSEEKTTVTLTEKELPKHIHGVHDPGHFHNVDLNATVGRSDNANDRDVMLPGHNSVDTTEVPSNLTIQEAGKGESFDVDIIPPYYALCFIMKVDI